MPADLNSFSADSQAPIFLTLTFVSLLETGADLTATLTLAYFNLAHFNNAARTEYSLTWNIAVVFIEKIL